MMDHSSDDDDYTADIPIIPTTLLPTSPINENLHVEEVIHIPIEYPAQIAFFIIVYFESQMYHL